MKIFNGTPCIPWPAHKRNKAGYGYVAINGETLFIHRVIYENTYGKIPTKMTVDHLCRSRHCINTSHMEIVSRGENTMRGECACAKNARKTHCAHGHPLSGENLYMMPNKLGRAWRSCKECCRMAKARYKAKKRGTL